MQKTAAQIADYVLNKLATITSEDIRTSLAGEGGRPVDNSEIDEWVKSTAEAAQRLYANTPTRHTVGGGLMGGGMGGLLGGILSGSKGALAGLGIGGAAGAGLGYLSGKATQRYNQMRDTEKARGLGMIAQQGSVPLQLPSYVTMQDLMQYATDRRPNAAPVNMEELMRMQNALQEHHRSQATMEGLYRGLNQSNLQDISREDEGRVMGDRLLNTGMTTGLSVTQAHLERRRLAALQAQKIQDMIDRGYGHLAERYQRDAMLG